MISKIHYKFPFPLISLNFSYYFIKQSPINSLLFDSKSKMVCSYCPLLINLFKIKSLLVFYIMTVLNLSVDCSERHTAPRGQSGSLLSYLRLRGLPRPAFLSRTLNKLP